MSTAAFSRPSITLLRIRREGNAISHIGNVFDDRGLTKLASQAADGDKHGIGKRVGVLVPYLFEQVFGAEEGGVRSQHRFENGELLCREIKAPAIAISGARTGIKLDTSSTEDPVASSRLATCEGAYS